MTDPAVEAARNALAKVGFGRSGHVQRVAAAREALKPIREQSEALSGYAQSLIEDGSLSESAKGAAILEALGVIAPFLYSTEELGR
jgi:hypothetical protein